VILLDSSYNRRRSSISANRKRFQPSRLRLDWKIESLNCNRWWSYEEWICKNESVTFFITRTADCFDQ